MTNKKTNPFLMITCERASTSFPSFVQNLINTSPKYAIPESIIDSSLSYDKGAYEAYWRLVKTLKPDFYAAGKYSSLLVDLEKEITDKRCISKYMQNFSSTIHEKIEVVWKRYRNNLDRFISNKISRSEKSENPQKPVIVHLAIHSFENDPSNSIQNADIEFYHSSRSKSERSIVDNISSELKARVPMLRIIRKSEKRGGIISTLRKKYGTAYAGIGISFNQKLLEI